MPLQVPLFILNVTPVNSFATMDMFLLSNDKGMLEESKTKNHIAPYVSFMSFTNLLDWLRDSEIPAQLDRSFWGTVPGSLG